MNNSKIKKLLRTFDTLEIKLDDYVIFGSGALAIRGLKEPKDLDVLLRREIFNKWETKDGWTKHELQPGHFYIENSQYPEIELYSDWGPGIWNTGEIIKNSEIISNHRFASLKDTKEYKIRCGRPKDLEDLKLFDKIKK